MKLKSVLLFLILLSLLISSRGQTSLSGLVIDAESSKGLAFVNIGIRHKNIGTSSLKDGKFILQIPSGHEKDSLLFSLVGYTERYIPIRDLEGKTNYVIKLKVKPSVLAPVSISSTKLTEQKFGITGNGGLVHITDGSTNYDDIFEIGQLIRFGARPVKITSLNLLISEERKDSGIFRINFYEYKNNRPDRRIVETSILQTHPIKKGLLKFDLGSYSIYLEGDVVAAVEFIPNETKSGQIFYEIKLGGSSQSFVRTSSQGEWSTPPHHYRLFVTGLVAGANKQVDEDEETKPTTVLFSKFVRDSFSIFVNLPENHKRKKLPVIYLLDANVYFDMVANKMKANQTKAILVGIGYRDFMLMDSLRQRDYTFPEAGPRDSFPVSGGADRFLKFIGEELIPLIDKTYHTDTSGHMLMGHSLGGYFTLFVLRESQVTNHQIFTQYVSASPSLEYRDQYIVNQFREPVKSKGEPSLLLLTYGGREDSEDGGNGTEGIDLFTAFCDQLSAYPATTIRLTKEVYPLFGHMETAVPTFNQALKSIK